MDFASFMDSHAYTWVILPLLIFIARIIDVSMGTMRVIYISRGMKLLAPLLGFFEILIWLLAIGQIMKNLSSPLCYIAYAGGFAMGNLVGILIEEKLSVGTVLLRVITRRDATELIEHLNAMNCRLTFAEAHGATGPVKIIFTIIRRHDMNEIIDIINRFNPHAFYSVEDVRFVTEPNTLNRTSLLKQYLYKIFRPHRKGK
jgi:uncharacterized protein YebE (UPF0316 family)